MKTAYQRRQEIVEQLTQHETCSIQSLAALFSVSTMTIHRDLDKLVEDGLVLKTHGGAILKPDAPSAASEGATCAMCQQPVREQLAFVLQFDEEHSKQACCPHCGLMMLNMQDPALVLATDFLHGNKVNALQATYLVKPELQTCCAPAVLAFASPDDAERFQQGFGGEMMGFSAAKDFLSSTHAPSQHM